MAALAAFTVVCCERSAIVQQTRSRARLRRPESLAHLMTADFQIVAAGDSVLIVQFAERVEPAINARAIALAERLGAAAPAGVLDIVPTYRSVAVYFNPLRTHHDRLLSGLQRLASTDSVADAQPKEPIQIPVQYGGDFGPDLGDVARFANTTEDEVVRLHTAKAYRVFMLGFVPGFAYMGEVDRRIAAPRRQTPRTAVPAGSVGIAGVQTGIYPSAIPGGWQLIGRTSIKPFDLSRSEASLFKPGDLVRFVAVDHT
jgi:KipI family sensor histidine kinase inhibitor